MWFAVESFRPSNFDLRISSSNDVVIFQCGAQKRPLRQGCEHIYVALRNASKLLWKVCFKNGLKQGASLICSRGSLVVHWSLIDGFGFQSLGQRIKHIYIGFPPSRSKMEVIVGTCLAVTETISMISLKRLNSSSANNFKCSFLT